MGDSLGFLFCDFTPLACIRHNYMVYKTNTTSWLFSHVSFLLYDTARTHTNTGPLPSSYAA